MASHPAPLHPPIPPTLIWDRQVTQMTTKLPPEKLIHCLEVSPDEPRLLSPLSLWGKGEEVHSSVCLQGESFLSWQVGML